MENNYLGRITVGIPTKDRYDSLALTIQSIINQTLTPGEIIIVDDSRTAVDMRQIPIFTYLFHVMSSKGIGWKVLYGKKKGPHRCHELIQGQAKYDYIFRIDDDEVAEPRVLELLMSEMTDGVGAVAPAVIIPPGNTLPPKLPPNPICNLGLPNYQWFHSDKLVEAEHLYSCFLYRKGIADFSRELSPAGHREETMFSHSIFKKGYKLIINPKAIVWHYRASTGGIRDVQESYYKADEEVFQTFLTGTSPKEKVIVLDNGIGDHMAFKSLIPRLKEKYEKLTLAVCFPDLFFDVSDVELISIADAITRFGDIDKFNVYGFMTEKNWKGTLTEAFERMYL